LVNIKIKKINVWWKPIFS